MGAEYPARLLDSGGQESHTVISRRTKRSARVPERRPAQHRKIHRPPKLSWAKERRGRSPGSFGRPDRKGLPGAVGIPAPGGQRWEGRCEIHGHGKKPPAQRMKYDRQKSAIITNPLCLPVRGTPCKMMPNKTHAPLSTSHIHCGQSIIPVAPHT